VSAPQARAAAAEPPRDLRLRVNKSDRRATTAASRADLLNPSQPSAGVWTADEAVLIDFSQAIDRAASTGLDHQPIAALLRDPSGYSHRTRFEVVRDAYAVPHWGVVFDTDGAVNSAASLNGLWHSPDLSHVPGVRMTNGEAWMTAEALQNAAPIAGPHLMLHHRGRTNYGHWMMDCVVGPWVLSDEIRAGRLRLLAAPLSPWHRQTLEALGLPPGCITESSGPVVRCDHLIVPSSLSMTGFTRPSALLVDCFRTIRAQCALPEPPIERQARVYVAREPYDQRSMTNETELMRALDARGFTTVFPGRLSIGQQVQLFSSAGCVVGAHGSGLANVAYMEPGAHVVEISPHVANGPMWIGRLCAMLGLRYAVTVVQVDPNRQAVTTIDGSGGFQYEADIPAVLHALDVFGVH
jgi:capsular polysaccharide biosynthesis protein